MDAEVEQTINAIGYAKVLVALKPQAVAGVATRGAAAAAASAEQSIVDKFLRPSEDQAANLELIAVSTASRRFKRPIDAGQRRVRVYPRLGLAIGYVDQSKAAALSADSRVESIVKAPELSLIRPEVSQKAQSTAPKISWGIQRMRVPALWNAGFIGEGVIVGHLDTGIDGKHPALKNAIHAFAEFDMAGDKVLDAKPWDSDTHGTHTAGTIVGRATPRGSFGVAPGAKVVSAMVIEGGQVIDRVLAGMEWTLEQGARILSMSLGLRGFTPAFEVVTNALRAQNVLPIFAVGNEGPNTSRSPGNYDNVISVGAMDVKDRVANFSSSQKFQQPANRVVPDLVGPGVDILSCIPGNDYVELNGTSMATPHIAGLAALLLQAKPNATADQLETAIQDSCQRPNTLDPARANRGLPDAVVAFTKLTGSAPVQSAAKKKPKIGARKKAIKKKSKRKAKKKKGRR